VQSGKKAALATGATDHNASRSAATPGSYRKGKVEPKLQQNQTEVASTLAGLMVLARSETDPGGAQATPAFPESITSSDRPARSVSIKMHLVLLGHGLSNAVNMRIVRPLSIEGVQPGKDAGFADICPWNCLSLQLTNCGQWR